MNGYLVRVHKRHKTNVCMLAGIVVILLQISQFSTIRNAYAQEPPPLWWQKLQDSCRSQPQTRLGVEYCTGEVRTRNGKTSKAHVIVVDLHETGVKIEYIIAWGLDKYAAPDACNQACNNNQPDLCPQIKECQDVNRSTKTVVPLDNRPGCNDPCNRNYYPVMSLEKAVTRARRIDPNVAVVIDSDYGARTGGDRDHGPEGLTVVRDIRLDGPDFGDTDNNAEERPWLAISENSPLTAMIGQLGRGEDNGLKPEDWIYTGVGGAPWLIQDGDVVEWEINYCFKAPTACRNGASQVAVGLSEGPNPRWLFLVLAEKPEENDNLLLGLANFMKDTLGAEQAIKFDGGGSSQLWYEGYSDKNGVVYREEMRELSQYLAVIAQPGNGIELPIEPAPEPPQEPEPAPPSQPGNLERLLEWLRGVAQEIIQAWQALKQLLREIARFLEEARQTAEDLEQFLRNIRNREWWAQQLENWLVQCCGSLLLPSGAALTLWSLKKRRR